MKRILKKLLCFALAGISIVACGCSGLKPSTGNGNLNTTATVYNYDSGINYNGKKLSFIANGVTEYSILVPDDAEQRVLKVANEISSYALQMTGAKLEIVTNKNYKDGDKVLSLGDTSVFEKSGLDVSNLKHDGYIIKTVGDNVIINSNLARGVQFGGYTFLERFFGIRWLTIYQTHMPEKKDITVYECEIVEEPNYQMRYYMTGGAWASVLQDKEALYFEHMRFIGDSGEEWCQDVGQNHNTSDSHNVGGGGGYVNKFDIDPTDPDGRYLKDSHPEYFTDYTNTAAASHDICFTNGIDEQGNIKEGQSVASLVVDRMKRSLEKDTERKIQYFMFGHSDYGNAICHCLTCDDRREQIKESGMYLMLANAVVRKVNEWLQKEQGRTVTMVIFAYHQSYDPPVKKTEDGKFEPLSLKNGAKCVADKNLFVRIAPINANYTYSFTSNRQDPTQLAAIHGWEAVGHTFLIWDYNVNFNNYLMYFSNLHYLKENLRFYKDKLNAAYVMNQSSNTAVNMWNDDLKAYVASKLYWNLDWDVEYLMNEFIDLYYGDGADAVREVINIYEDVHAEHRNNNEAFLRKYDAEYESADWQKRYELDQQKNALFKNAIGAGIMLEPPKYISIYALERMINTLNNAIEEIKNTQGSAASEIVIKNINRVKITPMYMILLGYEQYYSVDDKAKLAYAKEVFALIDDLGITKIGEGTANLVANIKQSYGIL